MAGLGPLGMPPPGRRRRRAYAAPPGLRAEASAGSRTIEIWKEPGAAPAAVATCSDKDREFQAGLGPGVARLERSAPEWIGGDAGVAVGFYANVPVDSCYAPLRGRIPCLLEAALGSLPSGREDAAWIQAVYAALPGDIASTAAEAYSLLARPAGPGSHEAATAAKLAPHHSPGPAGALAGLTVQGAIRSERASECVEAIAGAFGAAAIGDDTLSASAHPLEIVLPWLESREFNLGAPAYALGAVTGILEGGATAELPGARISFMAVTPGELGELVRVPGA